MIQATSPAMKGWAKVARDIANKCSAIHPPHGAYEGEVDQGCGGSSCSTHRPLVLHLLDDTPINVLQADAEGDLVTLHFRPTPLVCKSNHDCLVLQYSQIFSHRDSS